MQTARKTPSVNAVVVTIEEGAATVAGARSGSSVELCSLGCPRSPRPEARPGGGPAAPEGRVLVDLARTEATLPT